MPTPIISYKLQFLTRIILLFLSTNVRKVPGSFNGPYTCSRILTEILKLP